MEIKKLDDNRMEIAKYRITLALLFFTRALFILYHTMNKINSITSRLSDEFGLICVD